MQSLAERKRRKFAKMAIASVSRVRRKIKTSNQCKKDEKIAVKREWKIFAFKKVLSKEQASVYSSVQYPYKFGHRRTVAASL